ncbi:DUF4920 domain-containing protein [Pontibacter locisalis]|uniref:DUF4920 domain-containing protein n=1 Tax=Pontibacter locisalis TaxID=1719035 RepID=A0ABW5IR64_9BACT
MNKLLLTCLAASLLFSCNQTDKVTQSASGIKNETTSAEKQTFGAAFTEENVINTSALQELAQGKDSVEAVVSAEIVESCQSKGCWMDVKLADKSTMKVTFRDYGFFLPVEDLKGRKIIFKGTAKREVISVEDQRHYAKDAGKPENEIAAITAPKEELRFVADGVILK